MVSELRGGCKMRGFGFRIVSGPLTWAGCRDISALTPRRCTAVAMTRWPTRATMQV